MMAEELDERELRKQIETRYKKRFELTIHAIIFVVINAAFWIMFGGGLWLTWMTLGWVIALAGHFLYYESQFGLWAQLRRDSVEREVQSELLASRLVDKKRKNNSPMRLTDDGEIEEVPDDGDKEVLVAKPKRG